MIVNECITGQDKKAYEQKLGEDLSADKILDEEYQLIKKHLFSSLNSRLLMDSKLSFEGIVCTWIASTPNLTGSQKKLNRELLNIVKGLDPCHYDQKEDRHCEYYIEKLKNFLQSNKNNQDLKAVLNLKRGESGLTVLHLVSSVGKVTQGYNETVDLLLEAGANPNIQSDKGRTPLHYTDVLASAASLLKGKANPNIQDHRGETPLHHAASIGHADYVNLLIEKKANSNIQDKKGATPLQIAIDNHHYYVEECFFTDKQKNLSEELYFILDECFYAYQDCIWSKDEDRPGYFANFVQSTKSLKEFLDKHKSSEDLKMILSIRDRDGRSKILNYARAINKKVVDSLLSIGAIDPCKEGVSLLSCRGSFYNVGERYFAKSTLWNTTNQVKLNEFLSKISKVQDMYKLEEVVNEAIKSGVRFGLSKRFSQGKKAYNFVDHVIEKISKLEKNPKVASNIICKLVSRGAVFNSNIGIGVIDALESEFNDHKANMVKAYENYISNTHKFIELAKSITNGELHDVKIDNSTLYLEYSGDSIIDVAKITDRAGNLGLTQGSIEYGRGIIRIGKSEVEIKTENGIRYYTDLTEGSDIVLTFYTSLGNVDVRLYPDVQDKSKIIVKVSNREEILEKFKGCEEELGNDCELGNYWVYDAIEQGYFERSGKLCQYSQTVSSSAKTVNKKQQLLQDLRNIESNIVKKEKNFDIKTHLIDIFKTLSRFYEEKGDISKTDLAKVAEKESKKLGLEGKYNWSKIFGLEGGIIEKAEKQVDKEQKSNVPNDFYLGHAINNGSCFFDSFRQSLEQQKGIKVTVEQLRNECKRFAQDNPPEWFISKIGNDFDEVEGEFVNRGITCNQYINSIGKNEFWGRSDIEGRVLCGKYGVKLHVAESNLLHTINKQQDPFLHQLIDSSGSKAGKIDYSHNSVLHIVNGGHDHFQPLLYRNKVLAKQTQEQKDSLCYSSLPSCSMDELKIEKAFHQHKALLVSRP